MDYPHKLRTSRLIFSRIEESDHDDYHALVSQGLMSCARPDADPCGAFDAHIAHWTRYGFGWWAVRDPQTGRLHGCGGLEWSRPAAERAIEVGYRFPVRLAEQAYADELVRVAVAQGFVRLGMAHVITEPGAGTASRRVIERAGFLRERSSDGRTDPVMLYRLTAAAWCAAPFGRRVRGAPAELQAV